MDSDSGGSADDNDERMGDRFLFDPNDGILRLIPVDSIRAFREVRVTMTVLSTQTLSERRGMVLSTSSPVVTPTTPPTGSSLGSSSGYINDGR